MPTIEIIMPNFTKVVVGKNEFYFSYETCVAFSDGHQTVKSKNVWSNTTGRHLNSLMGDTVPHDEFEKG